jgi:hypothetical protein
LDKHLEAEDTEARGLPFEPTPLSPTCDKRLERFYSRLYSCIFEWPRPEMRSDDYQTELSLIRISVMCHRAHPILFEARLFTLFSNRRNQPHFRFDCALAFARWLMARNSLPSLMVSETGRPKRKSSRLLMKNRIFGMAFPGQSCIKAIWPFNARSSLARGPRHM